MDKNRNARYDRYFEGYEDVLKTDENGEKHFVTEYVGMHYTPDLSPQKRKKVKILFTVLGLAFAAFETACGLLPAESNYTTYMTVCQAAAFVASIVFIVYLIGRLTAPAGMEISRYKTSHRNLIYAGIITAVLLAGCFVCGIIGMAGLHSFGTAGIISSVFYVLSAAAVFAIAAIEKKTAYTAE